jgi:hypothetical protein
VSLVGLALYATACLSPTTPLARNAKCNGAGTFTISPASMTLELGAYGLVEGIYTTNRSGCQLVDTLFRWSTSDYRVVEAPTRGPGLPARKQSQAWVAAVMVGHASVKAVIEDRMDSNGTKLEATAMVTVVEGVPVSIEIAAAIPLVAVGGNLQLRALVKNASYAEVPSAIVSWSISPPQVADITTDGLVTGRAAGVATVVASAGNLQASMVLTVLAGTLPIPVDNVVVTPVAATIEAGDSTLLVATARDASGSVLTGRPVDWQSDDAAVARVSSAGLVTGFAPGTANVTATIDGKRGTSVITVVTAPARYAWALNDFPAQPSHSPSPSNSFSSAHQPITIDRTSAGQYHVRFDGLQPASGESQVFVVSGYGPGAAACKLAGIAMAALSITASVSCYEPGDIAVDHRFVILMLGSDALPGRFAFGTADQPTIAGPYTPASPHSSNGQSPQIRRDLNGVYSVLLPGHARLPGGQTETAFVTAIGPSAARCTVNGFLAGEELPVHCVGPAATAFLDDDAPFTFVLLERGRPGQRLAFASLDVRGAVNPNHAYSSAGPITSTHMGTGRTDVTFAGLARTPTNGTETVIVGAETVEGAFCKVVSWQSTGSDLIAAIQCYDFNGNAADVEFRVLVIQ